MSSLDLRSTISLLLHHQRDLVSDLNLASNDIQMVFRVFPAEAMSCRNHVGLVHHRTATSKRFGQVSLRSEKREGGGWFGGEWRVVRRRELGWRVVGCWVESGSVEGGLRGSKTRN